MDINKLMQQAQQMQSKMQQLQKEIAEAEYEGSASNGLVKVVITGEMETKSVTIDPSIVNAEDVEMLQDLIAIAFNEAVSKVNEASESKLGGITKGLKLPGM